MNNQRKHELWALWSLAVVVISGSILVAWMITGKEEGQTPGLLIGGLMTTLPMLVNAIRNIGQSQAMQEMASQLGQSVPATMTDPASGKPGDPVHVTEDAL
jgi:hypothetical protein